MKKVPMINTWETLAQGDLTGRVVVLLSRTMLTMRSPRMRRRLLKPSAFIHSCFQHLFLPSPPLSTALLFLKVI